MVFLNFESPIRLHGKEQQFFFSLFFFLFGPLGRVTGVWNGIMKINEIFWCWVNYPFLHFPNSEARYYTIRSLNSACYWNNNFPTNSVSQTRFTDAHPPPSTQNRTFTTLSRELLRKGRLPQFFDAAAGFH